MKSEEEILQKLSAGDHAAFGLLYNKYSAILLSYGIGLGFSKPVLEDAIQDVFFNVYVKRHLLSGVDSLKFYLLRSLKNRLLNIMKSSGKTSELKEKEIDFRIKVDITDHIDGTEEQEILLKKVQDYLNCLSSRQREAIYLRFVQEMKYEEIASMMNMTPASVRNLVSRAVNKMRKLDLMWIIPYFV